MDATKLAGLLDGRPEGSEITMAEEAIAKEHGLLVVFGYSDDNAELRGIVNDEVGCYDGGEFAVDAKGVRLSWDDDEPTSEDDARKYFEREKRPHIAIKAIWNDKPGGFCWTYDTDAATFARFTVLSDEDGEPWCEGVVIDCRHLNGRKR
jgi:hypothetical protein